MPFRKLIQDLDILKEQYIVHKSVIESSNAILLLIDQENKVEMCSRGTKKILGYTLTDFEKTGWLDKIIAAEDKAFFKRKYTQFNKSQDKNLSLISRVNVTNNENKNVAWEISKIYYNKKCFGNIIIGNDITENTKRVIELEKSEKQFRLLAEQMNSPVAFIANDGRFLFLNKAFETQFGYKNENFPSIQSLIKATGYNNKEKLYSINHWLEEVKSLLKTNKVSKNTIPIETNFGTVLDVEYTATPATNYVFYVYTDITKKLIEQQQLKESEAKFRELAENMPLAIAAYQDDEKVIYLNKCFTKTTGYILKDVPTVKQWYNKSQPNVKIRQEFHANWKSVVEDYKNKKIKEIPVMQASAMCKDKSFKYFSFSFSVYGTITYLLVIDITEQEKAKKQLVQSHQELTNLTNYLNVIREKERKNISREIHDELGQQLTGLKITLSSMYKKNFSTTDIYENDYSVIINQLNKSIETVRDISTRLRPSVLDDFGLFAGIEWLVDDFNKANLNCFCTFSNKIKNDVYLKKHSSNIFRIIQETLTNIKRHANASEVVISITKNKINTTILINDDGVGFNVKEKNKSLGLIGIRERSLIMNAHLQITSMVNKGTTIQLVLPL